MLEAVDHDLQAIPSPYRKPLRRYLWYGAPADHLPDLHALLCGDRSGRDQAAHNCGNPALLIVAAFLDAHAADLDIAHGHLGYVLRWQWLGGWTGR